MDTITTAAVDITHEPGDIVTVQQDERSTDNERLDQIWQDFLSSKRLASSEEVENIEENVRTDGQFRRFLLATMIFGGAELLQKTKEEDGALVLAMSIIAGKHWIKRTQELIEVIETQIARNQLALCEEEDIKTLMTRAEAELFE
ncbi:MAG: hypothetical protein FWD51_03515 [Betaproteobacteria bacterium]|nr:hypothetical protein [Betaproteobacteria bacterium]